MVNIAIEYKCKMNLDKPPLEWPQEIEDVQIIPRTVQEKKVRLPPIKTILKLDEFIQDKVEFIEELPSEAEGLSVIEPYIKIDAESFIPDHNAIPSLVPMESEKENELPFFKVERMPVIEGCAEEPDEEARRSCTEKLLLRHIYKNLKFPQMAKENGIEGTTVLSFIVGKSGNIEDIKIIRDIGGNCGNAALKSIEKLPSWSPGIQNGRPVNVIYTIPIKFKIIK